MCNNEILLHLCLLNCTALLAMINGTIILHGLYQKNLAKAMYYIAINPRPKGRGNANKQTIIWVLH